MPLPKRAGDALEWELWGPSLFCCMAQTFAGSQQRQGRLHPALALALHNEFESFFYHPAFSSELHPQACLRTGQPRRQVPI